MRLRLKKYKYGLLALLLIPLGCDRITYKMESVEDLEEFAQNLPGSFQKSVTKGDYTFTLSYQPEALLMVNEHKYLEELYAKKASQMRINEQLSFISEQERSFSKSLHFRLTITPNGDNDLIFKEMEQGFGSYSSWLQKLLFEMQHYVEASSGGLEEIPLQHYQMTRNFGTSKSRTFLLQFPTNWNQQQLVNGEPLTIHIDEFGLGIGQLSFAFSTPLPEIEFINELQTKHESKTS